MRQAHKACGNRTGNVRPVHIGVRLVHIRGGWASCEMHDPAARYLGRYLGHLRADLRSSVCGGGMADSRLL